MKILFVIPSMVGGGAERVVANLSNSMCASNDVKICTLVKSNLFYSIDDRVEVISNNIVINKKNKIKRLLDICVNFFCTLKFVKKTIDCFKPDCVISFLPEADILCYLCCRNDKNILNVYSERNDPTKRNILMQIILKKVYRSADLLVCQSKKVFDYYDHVSNDKKIVIPNPISDALPKKISTEKNHNIVSIGRFYDQKNFELLVKSYISVVDKLPKDCNLIIYGDGPLKNKIKELINTSNLQRRIILPGVEKNIYELIKTSALFVLSSDYEGFPNSLIEAMALGLPVISTDFYTGVAHEIIKKDNGIVVPINDSLKLGNAIVELMNDEKRRNKMRRSNYFVRNIYDSEKISNMWINAITSLKGR